MSSEVLDIVDEHDNVVGTIVRGESGSDVAPRRIVHVFVFDDKGRLLLQKRSQTVKFKPGAWATAACGHVLSGESYDQAAIREMKEEIGVAVKPAFFSRDKFNEEGFGFRFLGSFKLVHNGPFTVDPEEVDRVEYFTLAEIEELIKKEDFHPETVYLLRRHFLPKA